MQRRDLNVLPLRLTPLQDEAFDGFLARAARLLHVSVLAMLEQLSLTQGRGQRVRGLSTMLTTEQVEHVAYQLSLAPEQVTGMTVARHGVLDVPRVASHFGSLLDGPSPWCPRCVQEGFWDIRWRTQLMSVCLRHRTYLELACPLCERAVVIIPSTWSKDGLVKAEAHRCSGRGGPGRSASVLDLHTNELIGRVLHASAVGEGSAQHRVVDMLRSLEMLRTAHGSAKHAKEDFAGSHAANIRDVLEITGLPAAAVPSHRAVVSAAARSLLSGTGGLVDLGLDPDELAWAVRTATRHLKYTLPPVEVPEHARLEPRFLPPRLPLDLVAPALEDLTLGVSTGFVRSSVGVLLAQFPGTAWHFRAGGSAWTNPMRRRAHLLAALIAWEGREVQFWAEIARLRSLFAALRIDFAERVAHLDLLSFGEMEGVKLLARRGRAEPETALAWLRREWACHLDRDEPVAFRALSALFDVPVWTLSLHELLGVDDVAGAVSA